MDSDIRRQVFGWNMSNYLVAMEAAWLVRDVEAIDDAIGVAISEAGKRLNRSDMDYVELEVGATPCPACGEAFDSAYIAADTALVGLLLELKVFNADSEQHANRIAKSEVGGALRDIPLKVIETFETGDGDDRSTGEGPAEGEDPTQEEEIQSADVSDEDAQ